MRKEKQRSIHNYTEYNQQWNVFSAFNPSKCTHTWSSGQPTQQRPGSSWGIGALLKGLTSVVDNSCLSRDSNPQPRVTSPMLYPLEPRLPTTNLSLSSQRQVYKVTIHFCCIFYCKTFLYVLVFPHVWNDMRVIKRWQKLIFLHELSL